MNPNNTEKSPSRTKPEMDSPDSELVSKYDTRDPKERRRERGSRFALEFIRRRIYESREKFKLRNKLRKERLRIRKLKKAEEKRRIVGKKILEQSELE